MSFQTIDDVSIHPLLERRWSPRAFKDEPVEAAVLRRLFAAASWAPSSFNEQPWRFIAGMKGEPGPFQQLFDLLRAKNQQWVRLGVPVLILALGKQTFTKNGKPNRHYAHDVGQALAQFTVQATHEGLYVHQMAGFDRDAARTTFGLPEDFDPLTMLAVGHKDDPRKLPGDLQTKELSQRHRRALNATVFSGWQQPAPLLEAHEEPTLSL